MNFEDFRAYCLSMPGATEEIQWGADLLFKVAGKTFVFTGFSSSSRFTVKCSEEEFYELIARDGIEPADYIGRYKWVTVSSLSRLSTEETKLLVRTSYDHIRRKLPKRVRESLPSRDSSDEG